MKEGCQIYIGRAKPEDEQKIQVLAEQGHLEGFFGDLPFSAKKFASAFQKSISKPERFVTLKAELNEEIVGFLYCGIGEHFMASEGLIANVSSIYIDKNVRDSLVGGKVALRLIHGTTKWAKKQGAYLTLFYVTSGVKQGNVDKFFRRLGFKTLGGNYAI